MNHRLWSLKNLSIQTAATVLVRASWTSFDFIMGCSPRVNEDSESRWIIRFCFIKLEEKPFHSFHSSSNRERRESEIMIDYLSKKYNYMLQNGGKYHCHNRFHLSCGFDGHSRPPQNDLDPSWSFPAHFPWGTTRNEVVLRRPGDHRSVKHHRGGQKEVKGGQNKIDWSSQMGRNILNWVVSNKWGF